jgi:arylsulfatase A-like enzyme
MIEHLDKRIGDILAVIERSPAADNTIVIFLSDNGAAGPGSNLPLRGWKSTMWEGGIRVPCVLSWPREIPAGRVTPQVALNMDLTVTLLAAAGVGPASGHAFDGVDLRDVLAGHREPFERTVFFRYKRGERRNFAVRAGDLKLVIHHDEKGLFNLAADPNETTDLLAQQPERVAELERLLAAWQLEVQAPRLREFKLGKN